MDFTFSCHLKRPASLINHKRRKDVGLSQLRLQSYLILMGRWAEGGGDDNENYTDLFALCINFSVFLNRHIFERDTGMNDKLYKDAILRSKTTLPDNIANEKLRGL